MAVRDGVELRVSMRCCREQGTWVPRGSNVLVDEDNQSIHEREEKRDRERPCQRMPKRGGEAPRDTHDTRRHGARTSRHAVPRGRICLIR